MSSENMSEEECSPPKCPRQDDSLSEKEQAKASGRSYAEQIIDQLPCNGGYSSSTPVRVTILADEWGWSKWSKSICIGYDKTKHPYPA